MVVVLNNFPVSTRHKGASLPCRATDSVCRATVEQFASTNSARAWTYVHFHIRQRKSTFFFGFSAFFDRAGGTPLVRAHACLGWSGNGGWGHGGGDPLLSRRAHAACGWESPPIAMHRGGVEFTWHVASNVVGWTGRHRAGCGAAVGASDTRYTVT